MAFRAARRLLSSTPITGLQVEAAPTSVLLKWPDGRQSRFRNEFLLDHCRCEKCFHPQTKQRLKTLGDFSADIAPKRIYHDTNAVHIDWSTGHKSSFPQTFLERAAYDPPLVVPNEDLVQPWGAEIGVAPPTVDRAALSGTKGMLNLLDNLQLYGFSFVTNIPKDSTGTKEVIESIGPIRRTHCECNRGSLTPDGGFWEFTANMSHGDLAYSSQALPAHTDTTYFSDPAGLQIFHLLAHEGQGGETLLVDGFKAASLLEPTHFATLSTLPVPCHASGSSGTTLRPLISQPVLRSNELGKLVQVRWNNEDRGVLGQQWSADELDRWYSAARSFEGLLRRRDVEYWVKLEPGTMLVINNWRVMHGRSAFTGSRRMAGAYIGGDEWRSKRETIRMEGKSDWDIGW